VFPGPATAQLDERVLVPVVERTVQPVDVELPAGEVAAAQTRDRLPEDLVDPQVIAMLRAAGDRMAQRPPGCDQREGQVVVDVRVDSGDGARQRAEPGVPAAVQQHHPRLWRVDTAGTPHTQRVEVAPAELHVEHGEKGRVGEAAGPVLGQDLGRDRRVERVEIGHRVVVVERGQVVQRPLHTHQRGDHFGDVCRIRRERLGHLLIDGTPRPVVVDVHVDGVPGLAVGHRCLRSMGHRVPMSTVSAVAATRLSRMTYALA
jgi:hypothetical protein